MGQPGGDLADAFKGALIGAVYLDSGFLVAQIFSSINCDK